MKMLVVFYSRTGNTRKVAEELEKVLECDMEEIIDTKNRSGSLGYLRSGRDAMNRKLTVLQDVINDPSSYDLIVIGTPLWAGHVSTPVRTYMHQNQASFKNVAFFCTAGGMGFEGTFKDMKELSGKTPLATLGLREKELKSASYKSKVAEFAQEIQMK
ncbi:flavodoxin [Methanobacterium sp. CWC-01]|uniref:flavodoxin family protein n=1 Tax=Methanobacterium aridiramus TaxID=2584467 RepID=UPI002575DE41|nr:flavodoxin [Methanobacterium sp. CWC-01]WJI10428.1 flavodoxin [Methanobacterium sp. CWC-01]